MLKKTSIISAGVATVAATGTLFMSGPASAQSVPTTPHVAAVAARAGASVPIDDGWWSGHHFRHHHLRHHHFRHHRFPHGDFGHGPFVHRGFVGGPGFGDGFGARSSAVSGASSSAGFGGGFGTSSSAVSSAGFGGW